MEEEININIGKYVETLVRQWRLIVTASLLIGILGFVSTFVINRLSPTYQASVLIASNKTQSDVSFGSAIKSVTEEQLAIEAQSAADLFYDRKARLESYVALVNNTAVAEEVLARIGSKLNPSEQSVSGLLRMVSAELLQGTDTIRINVKFRDPVIAAEIANAWGESYTRNINKLYGGSSGGVSLVEMEQQTLQAKADYDQAQTELVNFISNNTIDENKRQIEQLTTVIASLRGARSTVVSILIDENINAEKQLVQELYKAQTANQLLAIQQDQEARRQIVLAYIEALQNERKAVISEQSTDRVTVLSQTYALRRKLDQFIDNAEMMRQSVQKGGDPAAASNAFALTLLKTQVFAAFEGTNNLQVQNLPESLGSSIADVNAAGMLSDLDALISTLNAAQTTLDQRIADLSGQLQEGNEFSFLDDSLDVDGELSKTIEERYPELFEQGMLSELSVGISDQNDNPLANEALKRAQDLLQMNGMEEALNYPFEDTPIDATIAEYEQQVRDLNAAISKETSIQSELERARDLAWASYSALSTKQTELSVASQTTGAAVSLASPAAVPDQRQVSSSRIGVMGTLAGLFLGVVAAYAYEFWQGYKGNPVLPIMPINLAFQMLPLSTRGVAQKRRK